MDQKGTKRVPESKGYQKWTNALIMFSMLLWWKTFAEIPIDSRVVTKGLFLQLMQNSLKSLVLLFVVKWKGLIWTLLMYVYEKEFPVEANFYAIKKVSRVQ